MKKFDSMEGQTNTSPIEIANGSEQSFRQLVEAVPIGICTCDLQGNILYYNRAAVEIWGREPDLASDKWCGSLRVYDSDKKLLSPDQYPLAGLLLKTNTEKINEIIIERPDGSTTFVRPELHLIYDHTGRIVGGSNIMLDITERKLTERNTARLAAIVESSEDAIISKTLDGIVTSWNDSAQKLFGYTPDEMIGQPVRKLIPASLVDEEDRILQQIRRGERVEHFNTIRQKKNGDLIDISLTISPIKNTEGKIIGASKIARDITLQKKLSDDLHQRESRLRLATEATSLGIWDWFPTTNELIWDERSKEIFGLPADAVIDSEIFLAGIHPADRDKHQHIMQLISSAESGGVYDTEYRVLGHLDNKLRWVRARGRGYYDEDGLLVRFTGTMQDITAARQAEQLLRENEERLRLVVAVTRLGTWDYKPNSNSLYWSPECRSIYGMPADVEVTYELFREHIFPDDLHIAEGAIAKAMDPAGDGTYDVQYRIIRYSDHAPRWIHAQGNVYFDESKQVELFIGTVLDITAEKAKEQELIDSVILFEDMADNVPVMIWTTDKQGNCNYLNKQWYEYTGQSHEYALGGGWVETIHPDDTNLLSSLLFDSIREKKPFSVVHKMRRKDLDYEWVMNEGRPKFDHDDQFEGMIGAIVEINERINAEDALRESENRLTIALEAAELGAWELNFKTGENTFSRRYLEILGYPKDASPTHAEIKSQIYPEDLEKREASIKNAIETGVLASEIRIIRLDGFIRWLKAQGKVFKDNDGVPEKMLGTIMDITEQKTAFSALQESESRLTQLADAMPQLVWMADADGSVLYYNDRITEYYYDDNFVRGGSTWQQIVHPEDLPNTLETWTHAITFGQNYAKEHRMRMKDGNYRWHLSRAVPGKDSEGRILKWYGTATDIDNIKQIQHSLQLSEERLLLAIDATSMGTWLIDLTTGQAITSEKHREIMGYTDRKDLTREHYLQYLHPDDRPLVDAAYEKGLKEGTYHFEARVLRPGRPMNWIKVKGKTIYDDKGQPKTVLGTVVDVTDERNAATKMEESESRLRIAIESAQLGSWEYDPLTDLMICSDRTCELFGFESNVPIRLADAINAIVDADRDRVIKAIQRALQPESGGQYDIEYSLINYKTKDQRTIKARGKAFFNASGSPYRFIGTALDITEQKNAFGALQESEERFRTIANTAPVMIWMSGDDKYSDFFNTSWLNFTGRTMAEESGDGWKEAVYPDDLPNCERTYNESFYAQKPFHVEYRLRRFDDQYRWVSDNAVPRYTPDGKFIGFISACMDIDDEKRFNERLQESELLFKTIANVSPVGLWMTDEEGETNFINETWCEWTGIPINDGLPHSWIEPALAADKEQMSRQFPYRMSQKQKFSSEFRFKRKDGQVRWGLTEGYPYYDDEGIFAGYAGSITDITERKQNEMLKNDFLTIASHELKTPLTSIKAYTQLLSKTYERANDAFLKNGLVKVETQVNKMTKLVSDFLNLSKIESDKYKLDMEKFNISALVDEIATDIQMVSINHTIIIRKSEPLFVVADKEKISQVITNFLNNAVKYSPEDKSIVVMVKAEDRWVNVSVADKGIGIQPGEHEKIFQRFYRSEFNNNISFSGFGIGLYISSEIINRHQGQIGVISEQGKGAEFYFRLPQVTY